MSNNENPTGGNRQVPVETYKCSQCNFYTNHEYYLQQHSLTHGLQALMEHYKRNTQSYEPNTQPQSYVKMQNIPETVPLTSKALQCVQCNFETDQEAFYKQHILTHNTQFSVSPYRGPIQGFESLEENYNKPHNLDHNIPSTESLSSRIFDSGSEMNVKPLEVGTQNTNSFVEAILIKGPDIDTTPLELFRCSVNYCTFETHDENYWKQHSLTHDLQTPCPEMFRYNMLMC